MSVDLSPAINAHGLFLQNHDECRALLASVREAGPVESFLEVGVSAGCFSVLVASTFDIKLWRGVDNGSHNGWQDFFQRNYPRIESRVEDADYLVCDSHSPEAAAWLADLEFDFIWLDGDHTPEGVDADMSLALDHCHAKTVIGVHDVCAPYGKQWMETCLPKHPVREIGRSFKKHGTIWFHPS